MIRDRRALAKSAGLAVLPLALMLAAVKLAPSWRVTLGIYVDGAIHGLILGLIALGLVIVYRANRIINFAAADLGSAPASLAFLLWASVGWNIYLSLTLGLVAAIVLGILVEFLFLRIFFNAPRLILTVVTIGVTDLLVALGFFLPEWLGQPSNNQYPRFIHATFTLSGAVFDGNDLLVIIVVPLVLIALATFFRFSATGVALQASAENADRASLLGIPVRRLQSVVWAIAGLLAFIALFLRTGVVGPSIGSALDPLVLLTALGAAVMARMERMPTAVLSAVGLSIVEKAAVFHYQSISFSYAIPAAVIIVALLLQRTSAADRLSSAATSTWQATREIKAIPAELRSVPAVRNARIALGAIVVGVLALIPFVVSAVHVKLVGTIGIFAIVGLSLVVLTGWAGQVSLGQMAFVGVAGAVAGTLATRWHWDIALILLAAGATGAVTTVVVGLPTLRARGLAFAVAHACVLAHHVVVSPERRLLAAAQLGAERFRCRSPHARARRDLGERRTQFLRARRRGLRPVPLVGPRIARQPHRPGADRRARQRAGGAGVRGRHPRRAGHGVRDLGLSLGHRGCAPGLAATRARRRQLRSDRRLARLRDGRRRRPRLRRRRRDRRSVRQGDRVLPRAARVGLSVHRGRTLVGVDDPAGRSGRSSGRRRATASSAGTRGAMTSGCRACSPIRGSCRRPRLNRISSARSSDAATEVETFAEVRE